MAKSKAPTKKQASKKRTGTKATTSRKEHTREPTNATLNDIPTNIPPRSGSMPTFILDTGGWTIKHGITYPKANESSVREEDEHEQPIPALSPNISAKPAHQVTTLLSDQIYTIHNKAQLRLTWPMERGYTSDLGTQVQLWGYIIEKEGLNCMHSFSTGGVTSIFPSNALATPASSSKKKGQSSSSILPPSKEKQTLSAMTHTHSVMILSQPFTPRCILEKEDEIFFRTFGFGRVIRRLGQCCSAFRYLSLLERGEPSLKSGNSVIDDETGCCCVIDSGFSLTHIVPTVDSCAIESAIKRINIGGKILTNILKEEVGYRQYNMKDQFFVVNEAKEALCFVSNDFQNDIREARHIQPGLRSFDRNFILPDFNRTFHGTVSMPLRLRKLDDKKDPDAQADGDGQNRELTEAPTNTNEYDSDEENEDQIRQRIMKQREEERRLKEEEDEERQIMFLSVERFTAPEVIFRPSDIGLDQVGIAEAIVQSIGCCDKIYQAAMYHNIILTGGNVSLPQFKDRLEKELRSLVSSDYKIRIHLPDNPITYAWKGAKDTLECKESLVKESIDRMDWEVSKKAGKSAGEIWSSVNSAGRGADFIVI